MKPNKRRGLLVGAFLLGFLAAVGGFYFWQPVRVWPGSPAPEVGGLAAPEMPEAGAKVLVVVASPGELERKFPSLLRALLGAEAEVHLLVLTDGRRPVSPFGSPQTGLVAEQEAAVEAWGAAGLDWAGLPDWGVERSLESVKTVFSRISALEPDYVVTYDPAHPVAPYHKDTVATGQIVLAALARYQRGTSAWLVSTSRPGVAVPRGEGFGDLFPSLPKMDRSGPVGVRVVAPPYAEGQWEAPGGRRQGQGTLSR